MFYFIRSSLIPYYLTSFPYLLFFMGNFILSRKTSDHCLWLLLGVCTVSSYSCNHTVFQTLYRITGPSKIAKCLSQTLHTLFVFRWMLHILFLCMYRSVFCEAVLPKNFMPLLHVTYTMSDETEYSCRLYTVIINFILQFYYNYTITFFWAQVLV